MACSRGEYKAYITLTRNTREGRLGCEIYIPKSREQYDKYCAAREEIDTRLGIDVEWMPLPTKKAFRIVALWKTEIEDPARYEECYNWLLVTAEKFQKVFGDRKYS